jgi:Zn-dependent protease with chaperone function
MFPGKPCAAPNGQAALVRLVAELQSAARLPIMPDPVVLRSPIANAFALPGGRVYVLSALLSRARSPDELAGVLAHEFGHVSHRDGLRRLIRDGGTAFLVGLLFGDVSGAGAALFAARSLLSAAYARDIEAGADEFAITVMHRLGRPTAPLGDLLQRLTGPGELQLSLLADHPLTPDRVRRLQQEDTAPTGPDLLTAAEWQALQNICSQI